jgi:dipeptidyl aminopeptidase/acylaminoacyl peptidase
MIIFGTFSSGLFQVSSAGGVPQSITTPDAEQGVTSHRWPDILPGDEAVLLTVWKSSLEDASIGVVNLKTGEVKQIMEMGTDPRYAHSGHLLYGSPDGSLLAAPFNLARLELEGSVISLLEGIHITAGGPLNFTVSRNGSLVYLEGEPEDYSIVTVDRQGNEQSLGKEQRSFQAPRFSPDGKELAVGIQEGSISDIWIYKLEQGPLTRLTFGEYDFYPIWTPDGERIVFSSNRDGEADLYWKKADGSSDAELLFTAENPQYETSLSHDGKLLAYRETHPSTGMDINVLPLEGERKPRPFLNTSFREATPMLAPNGRWLAYSSNESGEMQVYVRTFPDVSGGRWQASTEGGQEPVWATDGRELFYRSRDDKIVSVSVKTEPIFELGARKALFEDVYIKRYQHSNYDVHPDNKRFVMIKPAALTSAEMFVVLNWFEELKRLAPAKK